MCRFCHAVTFIFKNNLFVKYLISFIFAHVKIYYHTDFCHVIKYLLLFVQLFSHQKWCHFLDDDVTGELFKGISSDTNIIEVIR